MQKKISSIISKIVQNRINGGVLLIIAALVAIILANSSLAEHYFAFWSKEITLSFGNFHLFTTHGKNMSFLTFTNDALMTIFFLSVGLEIKREMLVGELRSFKQAMFPIFAALGGMIIPVAIYALISPSGEALRGMPIPMATDIAFSLGILSLFSTRVPTSLKVFLTTLAVADDIGGIMVIVLFYSDPIALGYLIASIVAFLILCLGGHYSIESRFFYVVFGFIFWVLFIETGIHPTIAGVLVAFTIPAKPRYRVSNYIEIIRSNIDTFPRRNIDDKMKIILSNEQIEILKKIEKASDKVVSPLQHMEDSLYPLVNYVIMPLFALANAGVVLSGVGDGALVEGIVLVVVASLVLGKFIGILSFSYLADKLNIASAPIDINWKQIAGVAILGGIGFTVSLFIANLSFESTSPLLNQAKLGIVGGSLISGIIGYFWLNKILPKK